MAAEPVLVRIKADLLPGIYDIKLVNDHPFQLTSLFEYDLVHNDAIFDAYVVFNGNTAPDYRVSYFGFMDDAPLRDHTVPYITLRILVAGPS